MFRSWAASPLILAAPKTRAVGDKDVVRVFVSKVMSGGSTVFANLQLHMVEPDGTVSDITASLVLQAWGMAHLDSYLVEITFSQAGRYTFLLYDTVTEDFHTSETDIIPIAGGGSGGAYISPSTPNSLLVPSLMALNESGTIRILLYGSGGTMAGKELYVVTPSGEITEITTFLIERSTIFTFITIFEMSFSFSQRGNFMFILNNLVSGNSICNGTDVAEWTSRIDMPFSQVATQRADIQRTFSRVNRG